MAEKKYLDYEGLTELVTKIKEFVGDAGKLEFKGTVIDVAHLPSVAAQKIGYMYTVQTAGVTTADFTDGAGKTIAANSEVAAVQVEGTTEVPVRRQQGTSESSAGAVCCPDPQARGTVRRSRQHPADQRAGQNRNRRQSYGS